MSNELCKTADKNLSLIFLPPYSQELNPIEKFWATLKKKLKKIDKNNNGLKECISQIF
ncbi:transposase [Romboutsia sp.]|uniref:transposase n=1 Tax=Romboutsia sp. TaxID=1965302 RepID=UPI003F41B292